MRVMAFVAAAALGLSCSRGARSPEEGYRQLALAVQARDARALFAALDQETRWSWMTIQRSHREAYDIVQSVYPDGAERARQIARFEAGAQSDGADALFATQVTDKDWQELAVIVSAQATPAATFRTSGDTATADVRGKAVPFRQGPKDGRWGYTGYAETAEATKRRAMTDLDLLRRSAADYERAAVREAR